MNNYCNICQVNIKDYKNMKRHLQSNRHKKMEESKNNINLCLSCPCGKTYTQSSNLCRHRKKCQIYINKVTVNQSNNNIVNNLMEQNKLLSEQNDDLKKQIMLLLEKGINNVTNSNNTTTHNIETQNVIVVNSFGKENTEYLTDKIVAKLIQTGPFTCLPKIIEKIHFDPDHPENHNIKVTNQNNNYAKIVKDNKWVTTNKKNAIERMIQSGYDILEEKYSDTKDSISTLKQEKFEEFQNKFGCEDKELLKNIKNDVDVTVINGTDKIYMK